MPHILLIEPDHVLAETYAAALHHAGHHVVACASAQDAVNLADGQKPDLVVLEVQLVGHSGIEFLYEFRSYDDWQNVPVLIHSQVPPGEFTANWSLLNNELGVVGYLYKPVTNLSELLANVQEFATLTV
ncbi:MAG TPA: response regulator [Candidatus Saccharimonadales bacterium]|nr:response regulator [Candidatus Saccharimonadales bacterium]